MYNAYFFGQFDVTELVLVVFVLFFFGLILYLRREDRREGYPLEDEATGRLEAAGGLFFAARPKTFLLGHGEEPLFKPDSLRESQDLSARRTSRAPGSPPGTHRGSHGGGHRTRRPSPSGRVSPT